MFSANGGYGAQGGGNGFGYNAQGSNNGPCFPGPSAPPCGGPSVTTHSFFNPVHGHYEACSTPTYHPSDNVECCCTIL